MNLSRYIEVLRQPGVARLALFATAGRLPFGILPLSLVLLMREESYSYGEIGAVVAAEALAVGLTAALMARLIDRVGQTRVILATGTATVAATGAETLAILANADVALVVALAAIQGATVPPISASMRALWSRVVPGDLLESAYAFDAIQLELVFVVGPLVAAGLASGWTPAAALLLCAALYGGAAVGYREPRIARRASRRERRAQPARRAERPRDGHDRRGRDAHRDLVRRARSQSAGVRRA